MLKRDLSNKGKPNNDRIKSCEESPEGDLVACKRWSPSGSCWKDYLHFAGPGWMVAVAYLDPGNTQADIQVGAGGGYNQLWSIFYNTILSIWVQVLCAKFSIKAQATLSEVQREQMPKWMVYLNWFIAEFSVIITDLPEVIGIGIAFNVFFGWPYYAGVLLSPFTTMLFLATQEMKFGMRIMEAIVAILLGIMALTLFIEMGKYHPDGKAILEGTIFGFAKKDGFDLFTFIGVMGAVVMPHNLYLHTASILSRPIIREQSTIKKAILWTGLEPILPIALSYFINVALVTVAAESIYYDSSICGNNCANIGNTDFGDFLNVKGGKLLWGLALLAAGQSSAVTTTYSGQYIMDGFLQMRLPSWQRAIGTRTIALIPCVIIAAIAEAQALNIIVNIVNAALGFLLPFALTPLVKYSTSTAYLGSENTPHIAERIIVWVGAFAVYAVNAFQLSASGGGFFGGMMQGTTQNLTLNEGQTFVVVTQTAGSVQSAIWNDVLQIFYFAWNAYVVLMPIKKPMRPLAEARLVEEEQCFGVVSLFSRIEAK